MAIVIGIAALVAIVRPSTRHWLRLFDWPIALAEVPIGFLFAVALGSSLPMLLDRFFAYL